jgi:NAD(P)-dependent dehydrogenase (short-subunit alcohol dehydrogenase family)
MKDKTCVITGATDGIGLETARRLAALGARLVLVGRNKTKGEAALALLRAQMPGVAVEIHYGDLSRRSEIVRVAAEILRAAPRIDVLINNAGAIFARRETTPEGLERTFALNHLGYFLLTALLRDRLIASAPARIVNVASEAHRNAVLDFADLQGAARYSGWEAYRRSKLANILFTRALAKRIAGTGVTANCLHPGFVATSFGDNNRGLFGAGVRIAKRVSAISVARGAETPVYVASAPDLEGVSGRYFDKSRERAPSAAALDDDAAARLWQESARLVGLSSAV